MRGYAGQLGQAMESISTLGLPVRVKKVAVGRAIHQVSYVEAVEIAEGAGGDEMVVDTVQV